MAARCAGSELGVVGCWTKRVAVESPATAFQSNEGGIPLRGDLFHGESFAENMFQHFYTFFKHQNPSA